MDLRSEQIKNTFSDNVTMQLRKIDITQTEPICVMDFYAAPSSWNFFKKLNDNKMFELTESIVANGLMAPVIAIKLKKEDNAFGLDENDPYGFEGEDYMIISGHNRVRAYLGLLNNDSLCEHYATIPTCLIDVDTTAFQMRNLIVDANYTGRELSHSERADAIHYKYTIYEAEKLKKGMIIDYIANDLDISPRTVYRYKKLHQVIPEIRARFDNKEITLPEILKFTDHSTAFQEWFEAHYPHYYTREALKRLTKNTRKEHVMAWDFSRSKKERITVQFEINKEQEEAFNAYVAEWLKNHA